MVKVEHSYLPTPEFIGSLDEPETRTYRKFEMNGISAQFYILPKEPRQELAIAHDIIINKHKDKDKLEVEAKEGVGTTFSFCVQQYKRPDTQ